MKSENRNVGRLILDYIKTIYIIATSQKTVLERYSNLISLRSTVFQYKVFSESNGTDNNQLSDEEKPNLVKDSTNVSLSLCGGVCKSSKEAQLDLLDRRLRLDPRTFTFRFSGQRISE